MEEGVRPRRIDCDEAIELSSWAGICLDLQYVCDVCDRLLNTDKEDSVLRRALFVAALVAYARCFKGNEGVRLGLDETDLEGMGEGNVLGLHRFFIDVRNKHIAHSINPLEQVDVGVADFGEGPFVVCATQYAIGLPDQSIKDLNRMSEFLIKAANDRSITPDHILIFRYGGLTSDEILALPTIKMNPLSPTEVSQAREGLTRRQRMRGNRPPSGT